jgi:hypothetical protein
MIANATPPPGSQPLTPPVMGLLPPLAGLMLVNALVGSCLC